MERNKCLLFVFLMMLSFSSPAQKVSEVLSKMNKQLTAPVPLSFNTKYSLYKDNKAKEVYQSYAGIFQKSADNQIYMKIDNTEFINTKKISLKVDHKQQAMVVSSPQKFSTGDFDVSQLLKFCTVKSFKDYKSYWELTLISKEFSGLGFSEIIVWINKDYTLKKQFFYYNSGVDFSKSYNKQDLHKPRLEIEYSNYTHAEISQLKFDSSSFFSDNKANKAMGAGKYKNYEIIDNRNTKQPIN